MKNDATTSMLTSSEPGKSLPSPAYQAADFDHQGNQVQCNWHKTN